MTTMTTMHTQWAAAAAAASIGAGCASLPPAEMELPAVLATAAPQTIEGLKAGRSGQLQVAGETARYERGASRLDVFGVIAQDRATVQYTLARDGTAASCKLIGNTGAVGVVQVPLKRAAYACEYRRDGAPLPQRLDLRAVDAAYGTRDERRGRFSAGTTVVELQSVHRVQGSSLPLAAPIGYVFSHEGRPIGAVELNGLKPRLWRLDAPAPVAEAVTHAAIALALLWDPAQANP